MNTNRLKKRLINGLVIVSFAFAFGCNKSDFDKDNTGAAASGSDSGSNTAQQVMQSPKFTIDLLQGTILLYHEGTDTINDPSTGALQMSSGNSYILNMISTDTNASQYIYNMVVKDVNGVVKFTKTLGPGGNTIGSSSALLALPSGAYSTTITASYSGMLDSVHDSYIIYIPCSQTQINSFALDGSKITISLDTQNWYTVNTTAGFASGGVGPYKCAFDLNGDGILDSNYVSCSTGFTNFSSHVLGNTITVKALDQGCNITKTATRTLPSTSLFSFTIADAYNSVMSSPVAEPYIAGQISSITNAGPKTNFNFFSTKTAQVKPVVCKFSKDVGGTTGTFFVKSSFGYPHTNSQGQPVLNLEENAVIFSNLTVSDTFNPVDGTGTLTVGGNSATVSGAKYNTDKNPDGTGMLRFESPNGSHCTGTIVPVVLPAAGVPCASGSQTNFRPDYTVEVKIQYSCTAMPNSSIASSSIGITQGSAFCKYHSVDGCIGSGGSGGVPIDQY